MTLFDNVCELCKQNKMNVTRLERECGLANATIRRWKSTFPKADNLIKVADYFDVSTDYLLGRPQFVIADDILKYAQEFSNLPDDKKDLVKCYISVVKAG